MDEKVLPAQPCGGPALGVLRRYDVGELPAPEAAPVKAHVDGCAACGAVLREFEAERQAVKFAVPFGVLEARAFPKKPAPWWRKAWAYLALPALGAAAALALMPRGNPSEIEGIRSKGGSSVEYLVRTNDGARPGSEADPLKAGDQIRLRYDNAEHSPYVLIVGVDSDGKVFPYLAEGDRSARAQQGTNLVNSAVTLDADPRPERVFALFSNEPIGVDEVRPAAKDALAAAGDITKVVSLPVQGASQASVLLRKAGP